MEARIRGCEGFSASHQVDQKRLTLIRHSARPSDRPTIAAATPSASPWPGNGIEIRRRHKFYNNEKNLVGEVSAPAAGVRPERLLSTPLHLERRRQLEVAPVAGRVPRREPRVGCERPLRFDRSRGAKSRRQSNGARLCCGICSWDRTPIVICNYFIISNLQIYYGGGGGIRTHVPSFYPDNSISSRARYGRTSLPLRTGGRARLG